MKRIYIIALALALILILAACGPNIQEVPSSAQAPAADPAAIIAPTITPTQIPTSPTPTPMNTPIPTPTPEATEVPVNEDDIADIIAMKRADVEAKYGEGTPIVYDTYHDYMGNGEIIGGFPVEYAGLPNVWVFYGVEVSSDEKSPYLPDENAGDDVVGIKLFAGSEPLNVHEYTAAIAQGDLSANKDEISEYENKYLLEIPLENLTAVWISESRDMTDTELCVYEN